MSGNAGGRPKAAHSIQELAREHAPEAIERLAQIVEKRDSHSAGVAAANAILDRALASQRNSILAVPILQELAAIASGAKLTVVQKQIAQ